MRFLKAVFRYCEKDSHCIQSDSNWGDSMEPMYALALCLRVESINVTEKQATCVVRLVYDSKVLKSCYDR